MREILVCGDVILDQTNTIQVERGSPEAESVAVGRLLETQYGLGGAANVAHNCKTLGGDPTLLWLGTTGGGHISNLLTVAQVRNLRWSAEVGDIAHKTRFFGRDGTYLMRMDVEQPFCGNRVHYWETAGDGIKAAFRQHLESPTKPVVVLADYDKGALSKPAATCLVSMVDRYDARVCAIPLLVDPGRHGAWERYGTDFTLFKFNMRQAVQQYDHAKQSGLGLTPPLAADAFDPRHTLDAAECVRAVETVADNLARCKIAYRHLVMTFGQSGIAFWSATGGCGHVRGPVIQVADTCGAGDTVLAALAVRIADPAPAHDTFSDANVVDAVSFASRAAEVACSRRGVHAVRLDELPECH